MPNVISQAPLADLCDHILCTAAKLQAIARLRLLPMHQHELETLSSTSEDEGDPFSKFGDSSSEGLGTPGRITGQYLADD